MSLRRCQGRCQDPVPEASQATAVRHRDQLALLKSKMRCVKLPTAMAETQEAYEHQLDELVAKQVELLLEEKQSRRKTRKAAMSSKSHPVSGVVPGGGVRSAPL